MKMFVNTILIIIKVNKHVQILHNNTTNTTEYAGDRRHYARSESTDVNSTANREIRFH
jgi:hypothetical protein